MRAVPRARWSARERDRAGVRRDTPRRSWRGQRDCKLLRPRWHIARHSEVHADARAALWPQDRAADSAAESQREAARAMHLNSGSAAHALVRAAGRAATLRQEDAIILRSSRQRRSLRAGEPGKVLPERSTVLRA